MKNIPQDCWVNPKIEIKESPLGGKGLFAKEKINKDEVVIIFGGKQIFSGEEIKKGWVKPRSFIAIEDNLYLGNGINDSKQPTDYLNHTCDSNLWMKDEITLTARKNIYPDEEITADYALWESYENWHPKWECKCRSSDCRNFISGNDWKLPALQKKYLGHFSPYLNKKIA